MKSGLYLVTSTEAKRDNQQLKSTGVALTGSELSKAPFIPFHPSQPRLASDVTTERKVAHEVTLSLLSLTKITRTKQCCLQLLITLIISSEVELSLVNICPMVEVTCIY